MTVPAAVPKERIVSLLEYDFANPEWPDLKRALLRLQHLEQLAERMTGALNTAEQLCDSISDMRPGGTFNSACHSVEACAETALRARDLIRSLIASIGEG